MARANQVADRSSLHRYRTEIPNLVDDMGLSVYAFRLYVRLKRVAGDDGKCFYSTRELAQQCNMGVGSVSRAKQELVDKDLIRVERDGHSDRDNITIVDLWPANFAHFARESTPSATCSPEEQPRSHREHDVPHRNSPVPTGNTLYKEKEEPIKKEPEKEEPKGERAHALRHFDPRKFVNGKIPAGTGTTPAEVFYEIHDLKDPDQILSSHALATISTAVDDLARWRSVVSEWELSSFKARNIKGQLEWYHNGIPNKSPATGTGGIGYLRGAEKNMSVMDQFEAEFGDMEITPGGLP